MKRVIVPLLGTLCAVLLIVGASHVFADNSAIIYACVKTNGGSLRIVSDGTTCSSSETLLSWNQQGPPGPAGPQGAQGPAGSADTVLPPDAIIIDKGIDNSVSLIDPNNATPTRNVRVPAGLSSMIKNSTNTRLYAISIPDWGFPASLTVIDIPSATVIHTMELPHTPTNAILSPDGSKLYIGGEGKCDLYPVPGTLSIIDTTTYSIQTMQAGSCIQTMAFTPDGTKLCAPSAIDNVLDIFDVATSQLQTVDLDSIGQGVEHGGAQIPRVSFSSNSASAYVVASDTTKVDVIDLTSATALSPIDVGATPVAIIGNPTYTRAYVVDSDGSMGVIDTNNNSLMTSFDLPDTSTGIYWSGSLVMNSAGTSLYVANIITDKIYVVSTGSNTVTASILLGSGLGYLSLAPNQNHLYISNGDGISVIDTATNAESEVIPSSHPPSNILVQ